MKKFIGSIYSQQNKRYGTITCIIEGIGYRGGSPTFKVRWLHHPSGLGTSESNQYEFLQYFNKVA